MSEDVKSNGVKRMRHDIRVHDVDKQVILVSDIIRMEIELLNNHLSTLA